MVGRGAALRVVGQALADTAGGNGQALLLVGEQGMGRTQLLQEARSRLQEAGHRVAWLQVSTEPSELAVSYSAALRLFSAAAGLRPGRNPRTPVS
jgi:chromosomal replication initiation ATPase DnaA